jgi:hypothetical protein
VAPGAGQHGDAVDEGEGDDGNRRSDGRVGDPKNDWKGSTWLDAYAQSSLEA